MRLTEAEHHHTAVVPCGYGGCYDAASRSHQIVLLVAFELYRCWLLEGNDRWFGGVELQPTVVAATTIASEEEQKGTEVS